MHYRFHFILCLLFAGLLLASCKKFLNEKPDKSMNVPQSLADMQLLLDNYGVMNAAFPSSPEIMSDNYYIRLNDFNSITNQAQREYYIWQPYDESVSEWAAAYKVVFHANVVLDGLKLIDYQPSEKATADQIKGSALFYRAFAFYSLAQIFAPPYDSATAGATAGIPLRLNANADEPSTRFTLTQTWQQVVNDLKLSLLLLPPASPHINRPVKTSAYAALARTFLAMEQYEKALYYADSALQNANTLMDFNTISTTASIPVARFNDEVIFPATSLAAQPLRQSRARVDSVLYAQYENNDLRKQIFFKANSDGTFSPKANYDGSTNGAVFSGLTTSELYLIKAEALARLGHYQQAIDTLNSLLQKRFRNGTFTGLTASSAEEALAIILNERRKELVFRGQRWTDLRRLNKDSRFAITLVRDLDGQTYTLPPNSSRYTLLIPAQVIDITGMPQNP